jgi:hypothetical protein
MNYQAPSPFAHFDKQTVIGALKATRSTDPDVLHAQKAALLSTAKFPKMAGMYLMIVGALASLTILLSIIGIPMIIGGWWLRRRGARSIAAIEEGFQEYTAQVATA